MQLQVQRHRVDAGDAVLRGVAEEAHVPGIGPFVEGEDVFLGADSAEELMVAGGPHAEFGARLADPVPAFRRGLDLVLGHGGGMVARQQFIEIAPWLVVCPCVAIAVASIGTMLTGEWLRRSVALPGGERPR